MLTEPRAWLVSKINRLANTGLLLVTTAQDKFDQHKDYVELDDEGNVVGFWADYFKSPITPTLPPEEEKTTYATITYSGLKPEIKIGGNPKKFTVNFFDKDNNPIDYEDGEWSFLLNGEPTNLVEITSQEDNYIRLKFIGDDTYIGSILTIIYTSLTTSTFVEMGLVSL